VSAINAENRGAWQALADELSKQRPSPGRAVRVTGGRKHKGERGTVERHQVSRYSDPFRYASDAQAHMREMSGRFGFACLVRPDGNGAAFWINAEHLEVQP